MAGRTTAIIEKLAATAAAIEYRARTLLAAESSAKTVISEILQTGKTSIEYLVGKFVTVYFRYFGNEATVQDTTNKVFEKGIADQETVTDSTRRDTAKGLSDVTGTTDVLDRTVLYSRGFTNLAGLTDTHSSQLSKPSTETLSLSDNNSIVNIYNRSINTTVLSTDDVNGAGADDDQNITFFKNTGNLSQVFDVLAFQNTYFRQFDNNSNIYDLTNIGVNKYFYDYNVFADVFDRVVDYSRNPEHLAQLADSTQADVSKSLIDSSNISDNLQSSITYFRQFSSSLTATDDVNGAAADDDQNIIFFKNTSDLFHISDLSEIVNVFDRSFVNEAATADLAQVSLDKPFAEIGYTSDRLDHLFDSQKFEGLTLEDLLTRTVVFSRSLLQTSTTSDILSTSFSKILANTSTLSDSLSFTNSYSRSFSFTSEISDSKNLGINKGLLDSLNLTELLSFEIDYSRQFADLSNISSLKTISFSKNINDSILLQDSISELIDYGKLPVDLLNITDDVNGAGVDDDQTITFFKNLPSELVNIASTVSKGAGKGVQETLSISSQGILLNQNYGADYFAQDYVGVSRSFT